MNEYGKVGFIDRSGNFVIEPQSFSAEGFSSGRALIIEGGFLETPSYRYIDKTGKPAFPGTFQRATSFRHGLAHVTWGVGHAWIDASGRPVFTYSE